MFIMIKFTVCILLLALMLIECEGAETKLQIGIKKKIPPEECKIKTKKGDHLEMHYTVCFIYCTLYLYTFLKKFHRGCC